LEKIEKWDDFYISQQRIPLVWDADHIIRITMEPWIQSFNVVESILEGILHD
jgi:hypothetical protein